MAYQCKNRSMRTTRAPLPPGKSLAEKSVMRTAKQEAAYFSYLQHCLPYLYAVLVKCTLIVLFVGFVPKN